jgi:hypothetical protein
VIAVLPTATAQYAGLVLAAYEDEVAGAAYFEALAAAYPDKSGFLGRCAALERATASQLAALIQKYQLTPRARSSLEQRGSHKARSKAGDDWQAWLQRSIDSYAVYVAEFEALEAIGPREDQPVLAALTAHEVRLIEWLRAEARA